MPMTHTETIEAIHAHLDEHPTDWQARRELADLLEDEGRLDEARYQRWAVQWEKCPSSNQTGWRGWHWWATETPWRKNSAIGHCLAYQIQNYAMGGETREAAEADLMRVLVKNGWPAPGGK